MSDLISRQDAIDALDDYILDETTNLNGDSVREILEGLPSAEPELYCAPQPDILDDGTLLITVPHGMLDDVRRVLVDEVGTKNCKTMYQDELEPRWTPCSEGLPKHGNTTYMTTVDYGELGRVTGQRFFYGKDIGWEDDAVVAWMPLPEAYKGDKECG